MKENEVYWSLPARMIMELLFWARRYCDGRCTFSPQDFNDIYKTIEKLYPELTVMDSFDDSLMENGKWWPFAQDAMYKHGYDATKSHSQHLDPDQSK